MTFMIMGKKKTGKGKKREENQVGRVKRPKEVL